MALYYLSSKHFSRGNGSRVTRAAAYRAGEQIRDQRSGVLYNHSNRLDIPYKEVLLPEDLACRPEMSWAYDRQMLWNAVEKAAKRKDAALARELLVIVPDELSEAQRMVLVRRFGSELANRYRTAVDVCLHLPRAQSDGRCHHAHLLMSTREVGPCGFGQLTILEVRSRVRRQRGLQNTWRAEFMGVRERWAQLVNDALRDAGLSARVDARSLAAQGIDREPRYHIPDVLKHVERRSGPTEQGDAIRRRYAERVAAREQGPEALARVVERQRLEWLEFARGKAVLPPKPRRQLTPQERKARRHERDLARRQLEPQQLAGGPERVRAGVDAQRLAAPALASHHSHPGGALYQPAAARAAQVEAPARLAAEARREKWAALEAQRVCELRRLEEARKQMPADMSDMGLERSARHVINSGTAHDGTGQVCNDGLELEI